MPGVPPDALAQVKKGFKGLFGRKKRDNAHPQPSTTGAPSTHHAPAIAGINPSTGEAAGVDPRTQTEAEDRTFAQDYLHPQSTSKPGQAPQIAEPVNVSSSHDINLDPSAPSNAGTHGAATVHTGTKQAAEERLDATIPGEGMSATSGPLSDDLGGGYGTGVGSPVGSVVEATGKKPAVHGGPKAAAASNAFEKVEHGLAGTGGAVAPETKANIEAAEKGSRKPLPVDPTAKILPVNPTAKNLPAEPTE